MLDLSQKKLTKAEWCGVESPLQPSEMAVIRLLAESLDDVNKSQAVALPLSQSLKVAGYDNLIFDRYLRTAWDAVAKQVKSVYNTDLQIPRVAEPKLKKADVIKFNNSRLTHSPEGIIEFVVLALFRSSLRKQRKKNGDWLIPYFTGCHLYHTAFEAANGVLRELLGQLMQIVAGDLSPATAVLSSVAILEENVLLTKYAPLSLFPHQRQLIYALRNECRVPKLITYTAPTGTGKTLSPLGLLGFKGVIFMCAARHVGLALARAAVAAEKPMAFAFGCESETDIRLHYSAAKYYTTNSRTGGIRKVDNSAGAKVQLMVCDMKSYLVAMRYMLKYRESHDLVWYWDEPTMTLDCDSHPCHELISANWTHNTIPNVVLSSATLPSQEDLESINDTFRSRFGGASIERISSHDCRKTITLLDKQGYAQSPHSTFDTAPKIRASALVCKRNLTLLRYVDLQEIVSFIEDAWRTLGEATLPDQLAPAIAFPTLQSITMESVKRYYLELILCIEDATLHGIAQRLASERVPRHKSTVYASSSDAHTLTDGPTMFMCEDTAKVGAFLLQEAKVPENELTRITQCLNKNERLSSRIATLEQRLEDLTASDEAAGNTNRLGDSSRGGEEVLKVRSEITRLSMAIQSVSIESKYIPNKPMHLRRFGCEPGNSVAFTNSLSEDDLLEILNLRHVALPQKLLLMLGIGVFESSAQPRYLELMKKLASDQKLYLIVASTDYTYGTNYQFCHGYVGSGLTKSMSREKSIQAFGRVGRGRCQQTYSIRVRDDIIIERLFNEDAETPELDNMVKLLS